MKLDILRRLNEARERRIAAILVTDVATGAERLLTEAENYSADPLREKLQSRFRSGHPGSTRARSSRFTCRRPAW